MRTQPRYSKIIWFDIYFILQSLSNIRFVPELVLFIRSRHEIRIRWIMNVECHNIPQSMVSFSTCDPSSVAKQPVCFLTNGSWKRYIHNITFLIWLVWSIEIFSGLTFFENARTYGGTRLRQEPKQGLKVWNFILKVSPETGMKWLAWSITVLDAGKHFWIINAKQQTSDSIIYINQS